MSAPSDPTTPRPGKPAGIRPLFAAGFVTAFGAHSIAANLGSSAPGLSSHLLTLGLLLALYDGAEVLLKPVFGSLADRIGPRPVLLGGLLGFAGASAAFVAAGNPAGLGLARFAQGAAAAAFSPAASTLIARIAPDRRRGRAFGSYGGWKGLGYALGPVLGGALVVPTAALAAGTAALAAGVGFLPVIGARAGLGPVATGAAVSVLATTAALAQPRVGRARDAGRLGDRTGIVLGLLAAAAGFGVPAVAPQLASLLSAAVLVGLGTGLITPLAFAALAALAAIGPADRLGQTMGSAEIGRELGDAGGPLLVGAVAGIATLDTGLLGLAAALVLTAAIVAGTRARLDPR